MTGLPFDRRVVVLVLAGNPCRVGKPGSKLSVLAMAFGLDVGIGPIDPGVLVSYGFVTAFAYRVALVALGVVVVFSQVGKTVTETDEEGPVPMLS